MIMINTDSVVSNLDKDASGQAFAASVLTRFTARSETLHLCIFPVLLALI